MKFKKPVVVATLKRSKPVDSGAVPEAKSPRTEYSPCALQTAAEIEGYYRNAQVGDVAVVRQTQHHLLVYDVVKVEGLAPKLGRVYVEQHGAFYMKSGKNCFHPKGQTTLVVPTVEVLKWAEEHPRGEFDVPTFTPEQYEAMFRRSTP